jgi:hypothetical protein
MLVNEATGWISWTIGDAMFQTYIITDATYTIPDVFNRFMGWRLDFVNQPDNSVPMPPP